MSKIEISDITVIEHFSTATNTIGKYHLRINNGPKELIFQKNACFYKIDEIDYINEKINLVKLSKTKAEAILFALEDLKSEGDDPNQFWTKVMFGPKLIK